jgi:hypothetical protein
MLMERAALFHEVSIKIYGNRLPLRCQVTTITYSGKRVAALAG